MKRPLRTSIHTALGLASIVGLSFGCTAPAAVSTPAAAPTPISTPIPNEGTWHLATNFLRASFEGAAAGICPRYDTLNARLAEAEGRLSVQSALGLLAQVSLPGTQWSVVYEISTGAVSVIMAQHVDNIHTFRLGPAVD